MEDGGGEREGGGGGGKGRLVPWADYEQGAWRAPGNKSLPPVHKEKDVLQGSGSPIVSVNSKEIKIRQFWRWQANTCDLSPEVVKVFSLRSVVGE